VSREGAFLVNNLLFVVFAFVVLLGTVFPLLYEAFRGQQVTVGAPYFNAMTLPIGLALLFLMSIGPALPWRKTTAGTLGSRLTVPAWIGALVVVGCVAGGVRGIGPLLAFGLGGFAAAANARGAHRSGAGAWRGLVGRANGGMVVHLGVVVIAVALAAATSFGHRSEVTLRPGQFASTDGHRITFEGLTQIRTPARTATEALVLVDGRGPLRPAVSQYGQNTEAVGTPAIDSSLEDDVYLTLDALPAKAGGSVTIGVTVQPLVVWLWGGGLLLVLGSALAAVPGKRRRPTDPVSAPVPALHTGDGSTGSGDALVPASAAAGADRAGVGSAVGPGAGTGEPDHDEQVQEPVPAGSP
jgi:cytochrome c-type biogenesis protein CcmF